LSETEGFLNAVRRDADNSLALACPINRSFFAPFCSDNDIYVN
jgi:hypothetical protein